MVKSQEKDQSRSKLAGIVDCSEPISISSSSSFLASSSTSSSFSPTKKSSGSSGSGSKILKNEEK